MELITAGIAAIVGSAVTAAAGIGISERKRKQMQTQLLNNYQDRFESTWVRDNSHLNSPSNQYPAPTI